ncbi:protein YpfM [Klebsiella pneumoniae]|nr:protein YpfM [Klebsiella pneumoniae]
MIEHELGNWKDFIEGGNAVNLLMTILICSHSILVTSG